MNTEKRKREGIKTNFFIAQGGPENLYWFENLEETQREDFYWTIDRRARPGDQIFIYLTAPVKRIVGRLEITDEPFLNTGNVFDNPKMNGKWCAKIEFKKFYEEKEEISYKGLRKIFYEDFGWVRYPRGGCRIPDEIVEAFCENLEDSELLKKL